MSPEELEKLRDELAELYLETFRPLHRPIAVYDFKKGFDACSKIMTEEIKKLSIKKEEN